MAPSGGGKGGLLLATDYSGISLWIRIMARGMLWLGSKLGIGQG